jgi:hypothetical protein
MMMRVGKAFVPLRAFIYGLQLTVGERFADTNEYLEEIKWV